MSPRAAWLLLAAALWLGAAGCVRQEPGSEPDHRAHAGHDQGEQAGEGAQFAPGRGIRLGEKTSQSLGVAMAEVAEKSFRQEVAAVSQVYREAGERIRPKSHARPGYAYASSMVDSDEAVLMKVGQSVRVTSPDGAFAEKEGSIAHIERELDFYTGRTEILVEIADPDNEIKFGTRLHLSIDVGTSKKAMVIPTSALLRAAEGDFVYVQNGPYLLRTTVSAGASSGEETEIASGLYAGDRIVVKPVETLWLIELKAVKGGGHSH